MRHHTETEPNHGFSVLYHADCMHPAVQAAPRHVDISDLQIQAPEVDFRPQTVRLRAKFCFFISRVRTNEGFGQFWLGCACFGQLMVFSGASGT
jgi:hypothetical protein